MVFPLLALLLVTLASPAEAGPWTRAPGRFYGKVSGSAFVASSFASPDGSIARDLRYVGRSGALYAELGILPRVQVNAYVPWLAATSTSNVAGRHSRTSFGDMQFGVQVSPFSWTTPFAFRLETKVPGYSIPDNLLDPRPIPGDGQIDITGLSSVGRSALGGRLYWLVEAGYRHRLDRTTAGQTFRYRDSVVGAAQLGWFISGPHVVALNVRSTVPLANDNITRGDTFAGLAASVRMVGALALEAGFDLPVWTRNGAQGWQASLGLSWQR